MLTDPHPPVLMLTIPPPLASPPHQHYPCAQVTADISRFCLEFFAETLRPLTNSNFVLDFHRYNNAAYYGVITNYLQVPSHPPGCCARAPAALWCAASPYRLLRVGCPVGSQPGAASVRAAV